MTESAAENATDIVKLMCPYCGHVSGLRQRKPGKYAPTCSGCKRKFVFTVPPYDDLPIMISPLKSQLEAIAREQEEKQRQLQAEQAVPTQQSQQTLQATTPSDASELDMTLPSTQIAGTEAREQDQSVLPKDEQPTSLGGFEILDESFLDDAAHSNISTPASEAISNEASPLSSDVGVTLPSGAISQPNTTHTQDETAYEDADFSVIKVDDSVKNSPKNIEADQAAVSASSQNRMQDAPLQPQQAPEVPAPPTSHTKPHLDEQANDVTISSGGPALKQPVKQEQSFSDILNDDSRFVDDSLSDITAPSDLKRAKETNEVLSSARERYKQAINNPEPEAPQSPPQASAPQPSTKPELAEQNIPDKLGGYEILDVLGKGGMGAVYKAKQLSLDRIVAIKVIHAHWADDPQFLSRFVREAYAAAQLTHHNVVQIYDIGEDQGINFFSMEYVKGLSLKQLIRQEGRVDAELAAGYILQACRGLKFAHDRGMVHRDIKPDNLMLNDEGVVKVADLGLVKTPGLDDGVTLNSEALKQARSDITSASIAMGTPAYMAPEQAEDAANVDHRADIYSLGCSFYVLLTGKPPFEGKTAAEVLTKHATEQIVSPELIVKRVPKVLSSIVHRMVAKVPDERYGIIDDLIQDLEEFLGIDNTKPFSPKEQHAALLEDAVTNYNDSKSAKILKQFSLLGYYILCIGLCAVFALTKDGFMSGAALGLGVLTALNHFVLDGIFNRGYLFKRTRQFAFAASFKDWLSGAFFGVVAIGMLYMFGLLIPWLVVYLISLGIAAAFTFVIDRKVSKDRQKQLLDVQLMLKKMRLYGLEENHLRSFVCKYAGKKWEAFYEDLFGFEEKISARERWGRGDDGKMRPKSGAWREPIIDAIDNRLQQNKEKKAQKHLAKLQRKALKAQGIDEKKANQEADDMAKTLVSNAAALRVADRELQDQEATLISQAGRSNLSKATGTMPKSQSQPMKVTNLSSPEAVPAKNRDEQRKKAAYEENWWGPLGLIFGSRVRFLIGIALLGLFGLWVQQNELIANPERAFSALISKYETKAIAFPGILNTIIPQLIRDGFFNSYGLGLSGIVLVLSCIFKTRKIIYLAWPAAFVAFIAQLPFALTGITLPILSISAFALIFSSSIAFLGLLWRR